jgi:hypothetical protein
MPDERNVVKALDVLSFSKVLIGVPLASKKTILEVFSRLFENQNAFSLTKFFAASTARGKLGATDLG